MALPARNCLTTVVGEREYRSVFEIPPPTTFQKIGTIAFGLTAAVCTAFATSIALGLLGLMVALFAEYTHLIYSQPWAPLIGLEYGFLLGIVLGAIVCRKVIKSRPHGTPTQ